MPGTFNCPTCGAPLEYPGGGETVRCPYCGNTVIVPEALRPKAVSAQSPTPAAAGLNAEQLEEIRQLMRSGLEIQAIKLYRQVTLKGLKEAKDAVEAIALADPGYQGRLRGTAGLSGAPPAAPAARPGGKVKGRIVAILAGLFFLAIASIFPLVFFPMGMLAWGEQEYVGAVVAFAGAVIWALVWGGIGVIIAFAKM